MRTTLANLALVLCTISNAQLRFPQCLRTDPYLANGYFILNRVLFDQKSLKEVQVEIIALKKDRTRTILQSFLLKTDVAFKQADFSKINAAPAGSMTYYHVKAIDMSNKVFEDVYGTPNGTDPSSGGPDDIVCMQKCNSARYSYDLVNYENFNGASRYIELRDGIDPVANNYNFFYVRGADWQQFTLQQFPLPSYFGLPSNWSALANGNSGAPQGLVIRYNSTSGITDAVDVDGYPLGDLQPPFYAVRKDRGDWRRAGLLTT